MTIAARFEKPSIPAEFTRKSTWQSLLYLLYAVSLYLLPAAAACYLLLGVEGSLLWRVPLAVFCMALAGQGIHVFGWVGHEGLHFTLHRNKVVSALMGLSVSGMTITFFEMGMAVNHWAHHRYTNTEDDPDIPRLSAFTTVWQRLFKARSEANREFLHYTWLMANGKPLPPAMQKAPLPLPPSTLRGLAVANLLINAFWLLVLLAVGFTLGWLVVLFGFVVPMLFALVLSSIRSYVEHIATGTTPMDNTRTRSSWLWTLLEGGANYHFEHHLFPGVPQWRLPRLHRYLRAQGVVSLHTDATHFAHWKLVGSQYGYNVAPSGAVTAETMDDKR